MKVRKTHTFDKELYEKFIKICEAKGLKASTWINKTIREFVEGAEKK
jgi:hypothetical protein